MTKGPGFATPADAMVNGPKERLLYVISPSAQPGRPEMLATIDADPESDTYSQIINRLYFPNVDDELHHFGWNACSSCHCDASKKRRYLILPSLKSSRVYVVDTINQTAPTIHTTVEPEELAEFDVSYGHSSHCLASGEIMISFMGDKNGKAKGCLLLLDETFKIKGPWSKENVPFGYDMWYQPRHNVLVTTEFGSPQAFMKGFNPAEATESYGGSMHFWEWSTGKLQKTVSLGPEGMIPLEVRFKHDPASVHGFLVAALGSSVIHFYKDEASGEWTTRVAYKFPAMEVDNWALPQMPALPTDCLISLDDKYLYVSNWLRGDVVQFDISDPFNVKLTNSVWVGGSIVAGEGVTVTSGLPEGVTQPSRAEVQGVPIRGSPQMIQMSLDGRRLYVTTSLLQSWDKQFYPEMVQQGSQLFMLDITDDGAMSLNPNFMVDFGNEADGPRLAHEVRYPGGDCTSDIWT